MSEKPEKLTIEEYNLYLKAAIKNLDGGNALYKNLSSELNRLAKLYTIEEVKKKKIWVLEMKKVGSIPTFCLSLIPLLSGGFF